MDRLTNSLDFDGLADGREGLPKLTSRQRQVAAHVAAGLSNKEIADRLVLSEGTVANHIEAILKRLQLRNRVQVAVWAARHGLPEAHQESGVPADR